MNDLFSQLDSALPGRVFRRYPLAPHTTYGTGGPAELALALADGEELVLALGLLAEAGSRHVVLGGGSNVLGSDRGVRGAVILTRGLDRLEVRGRQLTAGAGVPSHRVALAALEAGLTGAEFLTCLPGSIGGACYMNARAYGGEVSRVLAGASLCGARGQRRVSTGPGDFAYKRSPFQGGGEVISEVLLALAPGEPARIGARMEEIERSRRDKHELDHPSCGCVFKNDHRLGVSSGQLIERCGLKGYRVGHAAVSPHHANFVFNLGGATSAQIRAVVEHVRAEVARQTGVTLELEVQLLGDWEETT